MVGAVFFNDIVYNFASAFVAEIDIEIGHADALGIEKALEQQAVFHRVDAGYTDSIGGYTARSRASAGTHGDIAASRMIYEIVDYKIIVDIAHAADDRELIVEALLILLGDILAVAAVHPLLRHIFKIFKMILIPGHFEMRQLCFAELELDIAAFCYLRSPLDRVGVLREEREHLLLAFQIELLSLELHTRILAEGMVRLDADEHLLHLGILFGDIVDIVRGDEGYPRLPRQLGEHRDYTPLLGQAVILNLEEEVVFAHDGAIPEGFFLRALIVAAEQGARNFAREARRKCNKPLVIFFEELTVYSRFCIKARDESLRHKLYQILISCFIFAEQYQMIALGVEGVNFVKAGARRHIHLAADYRLYPALFRRAVKVDDAVHNAVIGHGNARLTEALHFVHKLLDAARAVKQAVFGMKMKVCK